jgi:AAHS family 4-hydroxybenzoate transporter-like MFS transporter
MAAREMPRTLDVAGFIEGLKLTPYHIRLVLLSCLVTFFDGLDFSVIAYTAPYIREDLGLGAEELGLIFSIGTVGQVIGGLGCSYIADRIGRRPVIVACTFLCAILTFLTGFANSTETLMGIRLLSGVAIGGLLPVAWALNIEAMPSGRKATVVAMIMFGFSLGASLAGPVTNLLAPDYGWHAVYFVSGAATILVAIGLLFGLPESVRFLVSKGAPRERITAILQRYDPHFDGAAYDGFVLSDEIKVQGNFTPVDLFRGALLFITPLIWLGYLASSIAMYLKSSWGPLFLEELGVDRQVAALAGSVGAILGAIAGVLLLRFTEARGPQWVAFFPAIATPLLLLIGAGFVTGDLFLPVIVLGMILVGGGHAAVISITSIYYPSAIRSNAGGWASSVAKVGGVIGPLIGALFLTDRENVLRSYLLLAACTALVVLCILALARAARRLPKAPAAAAASPVASA